VADVIEVVAGPPPVIEVIAGATPVVEVVTGAVTVRVGAVGMTIDGAAQVITPGVKGFLEVSAGCTITGVTLLSTDPAATVGSLVIDIWKAPYASFPPTIANTITGTARPTITNDNQSRDTTLTGWTTAIAAGDILAFVVVSANTITKATITLTLTLH
jgi:hypothetical protein